MQSGKRAVIIGAGPAGLAAAKEIQETTSIKPIVLEATKMVGGISQTVEYHGNRIDIGGHRFFSKDGRVMQWWQNFMPLQSAPSSDDLLLGRTEGYEKYDEKTDPQKNDVVMLHRNRVSRIFFRRRFFDYPISLKLKTFTNMGLMSTLKAGLGYLQACVWKKENDSLENFYINHFGRPLYEMFFEGYTEKVWGVHPSKLGADWGSQRVKGVSIMAVIKDVLAKRLKKNNRKTETSLIESFLYPKYGPGQLWETVADSVLKNGGEIHKSNTAKKIHVINGTVVSVDCCDENGQLHNVKCDYLLSSMPIKDLVQAIDIDGETVPEEIIRIASALPYRDFITVGLLVNKLKIKNETKIKTLGNRVPDTWIYIQERDVKIGRLQIFNNWSPYMVKDNENTVWIGLEYFCNEDDELWNMPDKVFIKKAEQELINIGILDEGAVRDSVEIRMKKAYPAYYGTYYELPKVIDFLNTIDNLYCIGRNGQHRYNNMDHSMLTAFEAVENIRVGKKDKSNIWNVNTEKEYHEEKHS